MPALRLRAIERVRRNAQVVLDREPRQQAASLRDDRDAGAADLLGPTVREIVIAEEHPARGRPQDTPDCQDERRLAGAVRAEQCRDLAGGIVSETSCSTMRPPRGTQSSSKRSVRHCLRAARLSGRASRSQRPPRCRGRRGSRARPCSTSAVVPDAISLPKSSTAVVVAAGRHEAHVVVDEDHERSEALGDPPDDAAHVPGLLVGQPRGRLVEQHDARLADDGPGELDEPAVARVELPDPRVGRLEADVLDRRRARPSRRDDRPPSSARGSSPRSRTRTAVRSPARSGRCVAGPSGRGGSRPCRAGSSPNALIEPFGGLDEAR